MKKTPEQIEHAIAFLYKLVEDGTWSKEFADKQAERVRKQEPYSDPRWYQPIWGEATGEQVEFTDEERREAKEELHSIMKKIGVLKEDE